MIWLAVLMLVLGEALLFLALFAWHFPRVRRRLAAERASLTLARGVEVPPPAMPALRRPESLQ